MSILADLTPTGWRCPDCQHVYAPSVAECPHCPRTLGQRIRDAQPKPPRLSAEPREAGIR